jgi:REP element-mobilizing transposase RayT
MARRLRFVPPDSLVEITCRTVQGRLLLRPSPLLNALALGVLARAARLYPVEIHAFAFLSNHYHLLLTVSSAQRLSAFMNYLNSNLAREAGRVAKWREGYLTEESRYEWLADMSIRLSDELNKFQECNPLVIFNNLYCPRGAEREHAGVMRRQNGFLKALVTLQGYDL